MAIFKNLKAVGYLKRRPKRYKAGDAPYAVGGNAGFVLASRPSPYPLTAPQKRVKAAAAACNIRKGMSKMDLMTQMVDCIPRQFGKGGKE